MTKPKKLRWDFSTVIKVGPGCRSLVPQTFADQGCQRVALITDKGLIEAGVVEKVREAFEGQVVQIAGTFDSVRQDNDTRDIRDCAGWYREVGADGLLAVGGGSVLDTAKCVKVLLGMKVDSITDLMTGHIEFYKRPKAKPLGIPHISLPTTAGTGADVSASSALFDAASKRKLIFFHTYMGSDFAFLDPELTVTLPPKLTAEPAFDSLSHSIESFFSTKANSMADAFALRSARLVYQYLPVAVENGDDIDARAELQTASAMSVMASVSALGCNPIHNFADAIGPMFGVSHGLANAVYLPIVMKNLPSHYRPRIKEFAQGLDIPIHSNDDDQQILDRVISEFVSLQQKCGIPAKLSIEIEREQIDDLKVAVKEDPAAAGFPLPDDVITACLEESMAVK
ncbi:MAG: iron-containing alcohol dehydrogenase [Gammaproteobacteria bacterium]|nr:iron-containing alcohol dehydrogenase [Gammaproteobacteria bacterium]